MNTVKKIDFSTGFHRLGILLATITFIIYFFYNLFKIGPDVILLTTSLALSFLVYLTIRVCAWVCKGFVMP